MTTCPTPGKVALSDAGAHAAYAIAHALLEDAEQAIKRVRALHRPCTVAECGLPSDGFCHGCGFGLPCPTIRALDGAS